MKIHVKGTADQSLAEKAVSDQRGMYILKGLAPGEYQIRGVKKGFVFQDSVLTLGSNHAAIAPINLLKWVYLLRGLLQGRGLWTCAVRQDDFAGEPSVGNRGG